MFFDTIEKNIKCLEKSLSGKNKFFINFVENELFSHDDSYGLPLDTFKELCNKAADFSKKNDINNINKQKDSVSIDIEMNNQKIEYSYIYNHFFKTIAKTIMLENVPIKMMFDCKEPNTFKLRSLTYIKEKESVYIDMLKFNDRILLTGSLEQKEATFLKHFLTENTLQNKEEFIKFSSLLYDINLKEKAPIVISIIDALYQLNEQLKPIQKNQKKHEI